MSEIIKIRINKYFIWFLVNFMLGVLPIVATAIIMLGMGDIGKVETTQLFSSFLAYIFTLLLSNLYLFYNYSKINTLGFADVITWVTKGFLLIMLMFYTVYSVLNNITNFVNVNIVSFLIGLVITNIIAGIFLSYPLIEDNVKDEFGEWEKRRLISNQTNFAKFKDILDKEGGNA